MVRTLVAIGVGALAVASTVALAGVLPRSIFLPSYVAVIVSAWYGGSWPGLVTGIVCVLGIDYFLIPPVSGLAPDDPNDYVPMGVFVAVSWLVGTMTGSLQQARDAAHGAARELEAANAQLQDQAAEMELANQQLQEQATEMEVAHEELQATTEELEERSRAAEAAGREGAKLAERLRLAQRAASIGVFDWHVPSGRVDWTEEEERIFGLEPGTFEGTIEGWGARVLPEDGERMNRSMAEAMARREPGMDFEFRVRRPDGEVRWVEGSAAFTYAADGTPLHMVGVNVDVTERHEAVARLRVSEARLTAVFEQAPVAVAVARGTVAEELRFELANEIYRQLLPGRDVVGHTLREVMPELEPHVRQVLQEVLDTGSQFRADEYRVRYDRSGTGVAEEAYFNLVYHPLRNEAGAVEGLVTVATEVTQQVRLRRETEEARARAEEANRAKSQFLATMSHELRTPLNAIGGYVQLIEMGIRGPVTPEQREDLERIDRSQRHLLGLINDVLDFSKLEAGSATYSAEPVQLDAVLDEVQGLVLPQVAEKELAYDDGAARAGAVVLADRSRLGQVLLNLLSNSIKFTPAGGRIQVACQVADGTAAIRVHDTGIGIPADKLEFIFQPFAQVSAGFTRTAGGTGLGLAISRDLARGMGGNLVAESTLGEGSTFTLTLPVAPPSS
jgi:PAS domain S-box-containing protein